MKVIRQVGSVAFALGLFVAIFGGMPWAVMVSDDPVVPWWLRIAVFCVLGGILVVLVTLGIELRPSTGASVDGEAGAAGADMLSLSSDTVPGRDTVEVLGIVEGHTVFAVWLGKDLASMVRLVLGGELTEYTEMMGAARLTAANRMKACAAKMGADAVINVRYMTTSVVGSAAELLVYGTAVKLS